MGLHHEIAALKQNADEGGGGEGFEAVRVIRARGDQWPIRKDSER